MKKKKFHTDIRSTVWELISFFAALSWRVKPN